MIDVMEWEMPSRIPLAGYIQHSTDNFWVDLRDGHINLYSFLDNQEQILKLYDAIDLIHSFEQALIKRNIID